MENAIIEINKDREDIVKKKVGIFSHNYPKSYYKFAAILKIAEAETEEAVIKSCYPDLFMVCIKELTDIGKKSSHRVTFGARAKHDGAILSDDSSEKIDDAPAFKNWVRENTSFTLSILNETTSKEIHSLWEKKNDCEWEIMFYLKEEFEGRMVGSVTFRSRSKAIEVCSTDAKIATLLQESFEAEFAKRHRVKITYGSDAVKEVMKSPKEIMLKN